MIIVGILLEITAAALGTLSKQLIAYSEHVGKRWIFHIGATINIAVGPAVDASAYAFAPQVVVAPFACLDVIFNALTAPYTLRWQNERFTKAHIIGTGLVAAGAAFTAIFGSSDEEDFSLEEYEAQLTKPASLLYMAVEAILISVIYLCLKAKLMDASTRGIALGVVAGILMGNVFFLKGIVNIVSDMLATGNMSAWHRPTPYACVIAAVTGAVLGHIFMRKGLGEYKGVFMVTIFEGAHVTAACLSGCVVMSEMANVEWWKQILYWLSLLTLVAGILVINTAAQDSELRRKKAFHIAQSFAGGVPVGANQIGRTTTEATQTDGRPAGADLLNNSRSRPVVVSDTSPALVLTMVKLEMDGRGGVKDVDVKVDSAAGRDTFRLYNVSNGVSQHHGGRRIHGTEDPHKRGAGLPRMPRPPPRPLPPMPPRPKAPV